MPFINIYMSAVIINGITEKQSLEMLLIYVGTMVGLNLLCMSISSIVDKAVNLKQNCLLTQYNWHLNKKMLELSYADVESYGIHALKEKINQMQNVNGMGLWNLINPIKSIVQSIFSVLFAITIIFPLFITNSTVNTSNTIINIFCSPWISAVLFILILMNIFVNIFTVSQSTKKVFAAFAGLVPANQVYTYYLENYIDTYHSGKDIRLYNQRPLVNKEMNNLITSNKRPMTQLKNIEFKYTGISSASTAIINMFIYLTIGIKALSGIISIGSIVQYIGGITQFITGLTTTVSQFTLLNQNVEALEIVLLFLDKKSSFRQGTKETGNPKSIQIKFENVSFTYPDTKAPVLKNINLQIHPLEKIAVVGMNGSGKTTLIKLLCRMYETDEGNIFINSTNIKEFDIHQYQNLFSVVFQDFQLFSFGLGQNVAASEKFDAQKAISALEKVGFSKRLEGMDLNTPLYKDFDPNGVEISGGEAQKIAIARAWYKDAPILVLDEPTAALDPQSEYNIYKNLNDLAKNKTAIFISHRMSSCRFCDRILVIDHGRLVQDGSYEDLMKNVNGKFYELWHAQEQHYS